MKPTRGIQKRYRVGYKVMVTKVDIRHRGGIDTIWWEEVGWKVEGATNYGLNMVSFTITAGWK